MMWLLLTAAILPEVSATLACVWPLRENVSGRSMSASGTGSRSRF